MGPPRDLAGLAPLSVPPVQWTVPLPLPGQRISTREWLMREFMERAFDATRRGSHAVAGAWRDAAKVADAVLSAADAAGVDIDLTRC